MKLIKYPRTFHIEGSNLQPGDEDLEQVPFQRLKRQPLVVEEKVDGSNVALSFDEKGDLFLQSRGHYLLGKGDKRHFDPFKSFAYSIMEKLKPILGSRYILYGEWLFAKHTIFYNKLNSYFQEFDIYDKEDELFLSTPLRHNMLSSLRPYLKSVRVLKSGRFSSLEELTSLVGESAFISGGTIERSNDLKNACLKAKAKESVEISRTDLSGRMEGLYIKLEEGGVVKERYKWVRHCFLQRVLDSGSHWMSRPLVRNKLECEDG